MALRVVSWNLMHGRSVPGSGRDLSSDFGDALASWEWDVALLQEVPPWWPALLEARLGAQARMVLTSRNAGAPLRWAAAARWPDVMKSNGGGANAIILRDGLGRPVEHRTLRLARWPERRWLHAVRVGDLWIGNLHLTVRDDARARREAATAARTLLGWADGVPALLGGDFNVRSLSLDGYAAVGRSDVDFVFAAGPPSGGSSVEVLKPGRLSDHAPLLVTVWGQTT